MVLLLSYDLLHLSAEWCSRVKKALAARLHIPAERILLAATHTHCGPNVFFPLERNGAVISYEEALLELSVQTAEEAAVSAEPSILHAATAATEGVAANRRDPRQAPDDVLSLVRVEDPAGNIRGHVVSFSCHPTVLSAGNLRYSADLFGAAASEVEKRHPDTLCVMFNGAAADLSTRFTRKAQTWAEMHRLGKKLARQILKLSTRATPVEISPIAAEILRMKLPFQKVPAPSKAQRLYDRSVAKSLSGRLQSGERKEQARLRKAEVEGAAARLLLSRLGGWKMLYGVDTADIEIQVLRLGGIIVCGLPGEFFGKRARELASAANPHYAMIIGYSNGYWGYVVPPDEAEKGGYEAMVSALRPRDEPKMMQRLTKCLKHIDPASSGKSHARR